MPFGAKEHHSKDQRLHHLRNDVSDNDHELTEIICIGCDARDNASRRKLIIERKIMFGGGAKCARAQIENHISDCAHDQTPPQPVQSPQADSNRH